MTDSSTSLELAVGRELLGYRIEGVLGRGGMGVVYLAEDLRLGRRVALKLLAPRFAGDDGFGRRLLEESRLAASLDHPNIVPVYEAGEADGLIFLSMRYVDGETLAQRLERGALPPGEAIAVVSQLASALDAAHERGLVHGDVKPSNALLAAASRNEPDHVYLADFGLTRQFSAAVPTPDQPLLGTLAYVAPEQIRGEPVDGRADVYSLGCLLYECLTGAPPFVRSSDATLLYAHLEEDPPPVPGLGAVVGKALAKTPEARFQTCRELVEAADEALGVSKRSSRLPFVLAGSAIAAALAAIAVYLVSSGGSPPAGPPGRLLRIDPTTNRLAGTVPVGAGAQSVAVGSGRVWVTSYADGTLWHFTPGARSATKIPSVGRPTSVTISAGNTFVAADGPEIFGGNVTQFDAATGGKEGGLDVLACSLTSGPLGVWVAGCPNVQQLSTEAGSPRVSATVTIPYAAAPTAANYREALVGMAQGFGSVWVIGDAADRRLWRIDPVRRRIVATIELGFPPATGAGSVWVTDQLSDRLVRIDPGKDAIAASVRVGRGAGGIAVGAGSVWVACAISHSLSRIDPATGRVVAEIPVPAAPRAVTVGAGSVWAVGDAR